ncbi:hypothetical protein QN277_010201 [Acacia crassicarpa]|uniref:PHD-type domain-containing protein n=1 Tax=Acacia crassicarpa TaxID=499986 RepID=A0AAE1IMF9_9FABA|nr:hypothetical protein QN277_010201 [Acacia crassicarpa]
MKPSTSNDRRSLRLLEKEERRPSKKTSTTTSRRSTARAEKNNSDRSESPVAGNILGELERRIGKDGYYYECLLCEDGGRLICCEKCPGTYHRKCLGLRTIPKGEWLCPTCSDNAASSKESFLKDLGAKKPLSFKKKRAAASPSSPSSSKSD